MFILHDVESAKQNGCLGVGLTSMTISSEFIARSNALAGHRLAPAGVFPSTGIHGSAPACSAASTPTVSCPSKADKSSVVASVIRFAPGVSTSKITCRSGCGCGGGAIRIKSDGSDLRCLPIKFSLNYKSESRIAASHPRVLPHWCRRQLPRLHGKILPRRRHDLRASSI